MNRVCGNPESGVHPNSGVTDEGINIALIIIGVLAGTSLFGLIISNLGIR